MVSSGTVNSDLNSLKRAENSYTSEVEGLSSSWKGKSYENLETKAESFIAEYLNVIDGQMTSFATACDLYVKYKTTKNNLQIAENNYSKAVSNSDTAAIYTYSNQVSHYKTELNNLKSQIESNLHSASSKVLTATDLFAKTDGGIIGESALKQSLLAATGKIITRGNVIDVSSPVEIGTKYSLTNEEIAFLAYVAKREQGSVEGAKLELSLMVNLYEKNKSKYSNVADYVANSGWFGNRSLINYTNPGEEYINAAKEVISEGVHYLPSNVVEHDCLSDITFISSGSSSNRNNYIPGQTIIYNKYGAKYKFVGFAPNGGDPFGYLV